MVAAPASEGKQPAPSPRDSSAAAPRSAKAVPPPRQGVAPRAATQVPSFRLGREMHLRKENVTSVSGTPLGAVSAFGADRVATRVLQHREAPRHW